MISFFHGQYKCTNIIYYTRPAWVQTTFIVHVVPFHWCNCLSETWFCWNLKPRCRLYMTLAVSWTLNNITFTYYFLQRRNISLFCTRYNRATRTIVSSIPAPGTNKYFLSISMPLVCLMWLEIEVPLYMTLAVAGPLNHITFTYFATTSLYIYFYGRQYNCASTTTNVCTYQWHDATGLSGETWNQDPVSILPSCCRNVKYTTFYFIPRRYKSRLVLRDSKV